VCVYLCVWRERGEGCEQTGSQSAWTEYNSTSYPHVTQSTSLISSMMRIGEQGW